MDEKTFIVRILVSRKANEAGQTAENLIEKALDTMDNENMIDSYSFDALPNIWRMD